MTFVNIKFVQKLVSFVFHNFIWRWYAIIDCFNILLDCFPKGNNFLKQTDSLKIRHLVVPCFIKQVWSLQGPGAFLRESSQTAEHPVRAYTPGKSRCHGGNRASLRVWGLRVPHPFSVQEREEIWIQWTQGWNW